MQLKYNKEAIPHFSAIKFKSKAYNQRGIVGT